jgi:putative heme degradation protein
LNLAEIGWPFEIKTSTIRMVQHSPFTGKEDSNLHLQVFIQLCQAFNMDGVTQDQMRASLFLFSLLEKALQWFHAQPAEMVQNWNALMRAFMNEYYSPGKTQSLRNKIATSAQYPTETISEAFKRFNEYTRVVPHHMFPKEDLVKKFYQGLTMASRTIIDASAGGSIIELMPTQAFTLFKKVADNDTWASFGRLLPVQPTGNVKGVLQVEK